MNATAAALRDAAAAFRDGTIEWGRDWFRYTPVHQTHPSCCALGGISYALDPNNADGDPRWIHPDLRSIGVAAMHELADYLVTELGAPDAGNYSDGDGRATDWERDAVEVVGGYNDEPGRTIEDIIAALEAAADRAEARQAVTA